ncbi:Polyribonucleotide nucleotidyltransferase [Geodia barretti]|uniref:polyribonucleotide nucleotidyltransferase n=1 Tax=Geodia barretti TaxID=519541 RepID=A0AA35W3Y0_GEOBA|nr:Polyribonucleotide nucleotidyltransferase [Geodia barretti]
MQTGQLNVGRTELKIETGKLAKQADGSVVVRYGETVVLVTACCAPTGREGIDFLPLTVDYRENTYASGRIPGGFFKREGKPTEKEVLTSRLIDRPIRPLFPGSWNRETQVVALVLSADADNDSDVLALTGASAALAISRIPFQKTIAAVRVGQVDGELLINPTYSERARSRLDLVIAGSLDAIVMVEAGAKEVSEDEMLEALAAGHDAIKQIIGTIDELAAAPGNEAAVLGPLADAMRIRGKLENYARVDQVVDAYIATIPDTEPDRRGAAKRIIKDLKEKVLRDEVLERGQRLDGRRFDEIREIWSEVGMLPRVHGSAVFTRGETQALVTATLGTADDQQKIEHVNGETYKRFLLHYNFPPFSVGEVKFLRGPGRREIGHGNLAERSLSPMVPGEDSFPYTLRVVSDILESNGSSSMATVCGATLALMDAGVPLKAPVAGVAMGLIMEEGGSRYAVLSDIAGAEDHYGDMDFKVAGSANGITALQMDIKMAGVPTAVMREALAQARTGRLAILEKMQATIAAPRDSISTHAPRIVTITIPVDKIRDIIGPGGKTIRSIVDRTGVKIDVEDDGRVNIASTDSDAAQKAITIIEELTASPELNKTYLGKVQRITDFGAFVEILPGIDGLLHVSEIAHYRVSAVTDELQEGDQVLVKVINVDPSGKVRLSRKALLPERDRTRRRAAADTVRTRATGPIAST